MLKERNALSLNAFAFRLLTLFRDNDCGGRFGREFRLASLVEKPVVSQSKKSADHGGEPIPFGLRYSNYSGEGCVIVRQRLAGLHVLVDQTAIRPVMLKAQVPRVSAVRHNEKRVPEVAPSALPLWLYGGDRLTSRMISSLETGAVLRSPDVGELGNPVALGAFAEGVCAADDHATPSNCRSAAMSAVSFRSPAARRAVIRLRL
jgi:hypothetical protein